MKLELLDIPTQLGKISNNVIKALDATEFTIPLSGIFLSREQLEALTGDTKIWNCWYAVKAGAPIQPHAWWGLSKGVYHIEDEFSAKSLIILTAAGAKLEFVDDGENADDEDSESKPPLRIANLRLVPRVNGYTELLGSLHVRPGRGTENLVLQSQQYKQVKLSISGTKVLAKDEKQEEFPFHPAPIGGTKAGDANEPARAQSTRGDAPDDGGGDVDAGPASAENTVASEDAESVNSDHIIQTSDSSAVEGSGEVTPEPETQANDKAEPNVNRSDSEAASQASEEEKDPLEDPATGPITDDYYKPRTYTAPSGEVTHLPSQAELDQANRDFEEKRRRRAAAAAARDATTPEEFERRMNEELKKHQRRPRNVINGRH